MANKNLVMALLCMVKNEEDSIGVTLQSIKGHIDHVIVYDTGSTDKTLQVVERICKENQYILHLQKGTFETFPATRNDALQFAETVPVQYLLLMDAGDEFRTEFETKTLFQYIRQHNAKCFVIHQQWLEKNSISDHSDIRLIRNHMGLRYDLRYPVHERLANIPNYIPRISGNIITLFQNRDLYGIRSKDRYNRDIDLLLRADCNRRNYYFLAQSYMSIDDYENGFKYNVQYLQHPVTCMDDSVDDPSAYARAGFCAIMCRKEEAIVLHFLKKAMASGPFIDAFIYLFKYCIERNRPSIAIPYIKKAMALEKPTQGMVNHDFYEYTRWHLISIICLMANEHIDLGYKALQKIIRYQRPNDVYNQSLYDKKKR